jgi:4-hydroxy-tetrahydrodipicolinate synthase
MKNGFYPAVGTPTGNNGELIENSYNKEIELMIDAGAQGVLCMGSMGKMAALKNSEYPKVAKYCFNVVSKRVPLMVGVMDCSVSRVLERIEALGNIDIDGVVATTPYYYKVDSVGIINFFRMLANTSKYPVYIYDLPSVTQSPVTIDILRSLINIPNIKGIKTANLDLILNLYRNDLQKDDFSIFFSGLDLFDVALNFGVSKNLDGMFTCTPYNSRKMYEYMDEGNFTEVSNYLNNILKLRNLFLKETVLSAYSYAMELMGCPGNYHIDYDNPVSKELKEEIYNCMKAINEI